MRKRWIVLAVSAVLAACSLVRDKKAETIEFWGLGREGEVVAQMIPEFERLTPGVRVQVQQIPWTAAHEKLLTAHVGKSAPDLAQVGNTWIPEFAALNALEDLGNWLHRSSVISAGNYFEGIWKTNIIDDISYGVPWYVDTRVLFYRKDLLSKAGISNPPRTWDEWLRGMAAIKHSLGENHYAILFPTDEWAQPVIFGMQQGSELLKDGGRWGAFEEVSFQKAFDFYVRCFNKGFAPVASNIQIANLYQQFAQGDFAMYVTGPWNLGEFRRRLPESLQSQWQTAPLPAPDGRGYPGVSLAGGASLVMFRSSAHKAEAWKLMEFLSRREQQVKLYQLAGDLPARQDAWEDASLRADSKLEAFRLQLQHVRPTPRVPEWERIATKIADYAEEAIRGKRTTGQALAALDADVNRMLEKRRWILVQKR